MEQTEAIEKSFQIAIKNGWDWPIIGKYEGLESDLLTGELFAWTLIERSNRKVGVSVFSIIFNHEFVKALWGVEPRWSGNFTNSNMIKGESHAFTNVANCLYHLMNMSMVENPVSYLSDNMPQ